MPIVFIKGKVVVFTTANTKGKIIDLIIPMSVRCYDNDRGIQFNRFVASVNQCFNSQCNQYASRREYVSRMVSTNRLEQFLSCEPKGDLSIHLSLKDANEYKESNLTSNFTKRDYYEYVYLTLVDQLESEHEPLQSQYAELQ